MVLAMGMVNSAVGGPMANAVGGLCLQSRVSEKMFVSGTCLPGLSTKLKQNKNKKANTITYAKVQQSDPEFRLPAAASIFTGSMMTLLSRVGSAQALTKDDVEDAYVKVEFFVTQVTTTAGTTFEIVKKALDQAFATLKPGLDIALPYFQQTTETVTKFATPLASDLAEEAQKALKSAGVDPEPGVEFAKNAAQQTSKVFEGAKPLGSSALESALAADPVFLAEAAGGLVLVYFLAPPLLSALARRVRGYARDLSAAQALDLLLKQNYVLIDVRTEKEKDRSGVPSLPSNAKSKFVAVPLEEFPGKIKSQLRDSRKVEAEVVAIKIASLKRLNKGSNIVILDESGDIAKTVARALTSQGFKSTYVIIDGFKGGKGWVQSRLGADSYSSTGSYFAEVLSPSRIIPAGTRRLGTSSPASPPVRFNLLPGGVDD